MLLPIGLLLLASIFFVVFRLIENVLNSYLDFLRDEAADQYPNGFLHKIPQTAGSVHSHIMLLYWSIFVSWWALIAARLSAG